MAVLNGSKARAAAVLLAFGLAAAPRSEQLVPYLVERTTYLEGILAPVAWWANPALALTADKPTLLTVNATPVGDFYTISSVRFAAPIGERFVLGAGVTGAGPSQTGTYTVDNTGATHESNFIFSRPSLQVCFAGKIPYAGDLGMLLVGGMESVVIGAEQSNFGVFGMGLGWLSPSLLGAQVSLAGLWTGHFQFDTYWDADARVGIRWGSADELVRVSAEYARPMPEALRLADNTIPSAYEVLKVLAAVRINRALDIHAGVSSDFHKDYDEHNGTMLHLGPELGAGEATPFIGGYDFGISLDGRWHVLHRLWLGYRIAPQRENLDTEESRPEGGVNGQ